LVTLASASLCYVKLASFIESDC